MKPDRYSRQTFLGSNAQLTFDTCVVAVVGLGGRGSHVVQQLAHLSIRHIELFDPDKTEFSNLNRLIGASLADAESGTPKVEISHRLVRSIDPTAKTTAHKCRWQEASTEIKNCDVIVSCVDSFIARQDLEATARRYMIPMVDIGMD